MATAGSVVVDLLMRTGSFETDAQRAAKTAQRRFKEIEKSANEAGRGIGTAFKAALGGAIFGIGAASVFSKFITETKNAQDEQAQLKAALASTGEAAGFTAQQLNAMASDMAGIFSEGDINKAQTRLLSYTGVVGDQFPRALQAAIDMSARLGMSVESASETVGKALDVPSKGLTALSKQGFRFTEDQEKLVKKLEDTGRAAEAQGIILSALEASYGGAAKAARDTLGGALQAMQNQIDDLMTGDDGSVNGLTSKINDLTDVLGSDETKQAFAGFLGWIVDISKAVVDMGTDFGIGISKTKGFVDAMLTYGTINPFNSDRENVTKYTEELKEAIAWRDRLLAKGDTEGAKTVEGKVTQIRNRLEFSRGRANVREEDSDSALTGWAGVIPTMPSVPVVGKPISTSDKTKSKKQERDEGAALVAQLEKQIALTGDLTEREKLLIDVKNGYTKFRNQDDIAAALSAAVRLDTLKAEQAEYQELQDAMRQHSKIVKETGSEVDQFAIQGARNIQSYLGTGLYDSLTGEFEGIGDAFVKMLLRMSTEAAAANISGMLFGDYGNTKQIGGLVGGLLGSFGGGGAITAGAGFSSAGSAAVGSLSGLSYFDEGGWTGPGGKFQPKGIVHAEEYVINADATRKLGRGFLDRLNGYSSGGLVGGSSFTPGGSNRPIHIENHITRDGAAPAGQADDSDAFTRQLNEAVIATVRQELARDQLQGGGAWNIRNRR